MKYPYVRREREREVSLCKEGGGERSILVLGGRGRR